MGCVCDFLHISPDDFKRATDVTYLGAVYGTLAALKRMHPRNRGVIVQVARGCDAAAGRGSGPNRSMRRGFGKIGPVFSGPNFAPGARSHVIGSDAV